jgi:hypothetical protein
MNSSSGWLRPLVLKKLKGECAVGSLIIFPYLLAVTWQYCVLVHNTSLAWFLAFSVAAAVWCGYVALAEASPHPVNWQFWLVVGLPLLLIYLLRADLPDVSFDVLNYHIFESERILRGSLYLATDFFPGSAPVNPTPDVLTGLYRHLLGYRLGAIVNYLALIWTGLILNRLLRNYISSVWLRNLGVLFILASEQLLFQINNYMVDLLALPLLLEATIVAIEEKTARIWQRLVLLMFLLSIAIALKLSNLFFAAPIVVVFVINVLRDAKAQTRRRDFLRLVRFAPIAAIIFIVPVAPFTVLMYKLTGNPIFPLYNGIFKSPFWPQGAVLDPRWGPSGLFETLTWPIVMFLHPERLSEFPYYSGRLTLGFILALICFFIARRDRPIRAIAFITIVGAILWSMSSGYIRYALYLELTAGILSVWLAALIWNRYAASRNWWKIVAPVTLCLLLLAQSYYALRYLMHWEWSQRQPITSRDEYFRKEYRNIFHDYSFRSFVADEDLALFNNVDVWIETTYKTSVLEVLLKPDIPVMSVRMPNFFETNVARAKFSDLLQSVQGKRMFTLTTRESLDDARKALAARGLTMGTLHAAMINYFSDALKFEIFVAEVSPAWQSNSAVTTTEKGLPLPDAAFKARLAASTAPPVMHSGQPYIVRVLLTNDSEVVWPGRQPAWQFQITVGNRWLTPSGQMISNVDGRAALFEDLAPGQTVELPLTVTAPNTPGDYHLELDVIQEGVAWFGDRGSQVLKLNVRVE